MNKLFPIFYNFTLNTTKHLDFLVFKKVLEHYKNKMHFTKTGLELIETLLSNFNTKRTNFTMPIEHKISITPYWFLGFIEGEGSFSIGKSAVKNRFKLSLRASQFTIALTESQKPVLDAIKIFIVQLGINPQSIELNIARSNINFRKQRSITSKSEFALVISDIYFIYHFFIPFLDLACALQFLTQKGLDYQNWKLGVQVLVKGLHLIEVGQIVAPALIGINSSAQNEFGSINF